MSEEHTDQHRDDTPADQSSQSPGVDVSVTSTPPAPDFGELKSDERTMGMLCHLLGIFTWFLGPLLIWLIKKDQSAFINDQGKEALNFQITIGILWVITGVSAVTVVLPCILGPAVFVLNVVFCIIAAIAANGGKAYRYPFAVRLIK